MPCLQMDLPATQDVPAHLSKVLKTMKVPLSALQPTNDLDLATVESMETFLAGYGGCLLVASHDRAFMEGLDRLFVLRGDGVVRLFEGLYSEVATLTPPPPQISWSPDAVHCMSTLCPCCRQNTESCHQQSSASDGYLAYFCLKPSAYAVPGDCPIGG